jgi:hypothetical protein
MQQWQQQQVLLMLAMLLLLLWLPMQLTWYMQHSLQAK